MESIPDRAAFQSACAVGECRQHLRINRLTAATKEKREKERRAAERYLAIFRSPDVTRV